MEDLGSVSNNAGIAATCMALQHILVKKGLCSYDELAAANMQAQKIIEKMSSSLANGAPSMDVLHESLKDMLVFIGGESALPSLEQSLSQVHDALSKETG